MIKIRGKIFGLAWLIFLGMEHWVNANPIDILNAFNQDTIINEPSDDTTQGYRPESGYYEYFCTERGSISLPGIGDNMDGDGSDIPNDGNILFRNHIFQFGPLTGDALNTIVLDTDENTTIFPSEMELDIPDDYYTEIAILFSGVGVKNTQNGIFTVYYTNGEPDEFLWDLVDWGQHTYDGLGAEPAVGDLLRENIVGVDFYRGRDGQIIDNNGGVLWAQTFPVDPLRIVEAVKFDLDEQSDYGDIGVYALSAVYSKHAWHPDPPAGAAEVGLEPVLRWYGGVYATEYDIYFGTDPNAVEQATLISDEFLGNVNHDPCDITNNSIAAPGPLKVDTTYYWRVDAINPSHPDSPWIGDLWSFAVGDGFTLQDLETTVLAKKTGRWFGRATVEKLGNGWFVLCYREAQRHTGSDGVIHIRFSGDGGCNWSQEDHHLDGSPLARFPVSFAPDDAFEPYLYVTPNGRIILHIWRTNGSNHRQGKGTWQTVSDDNGKTWSLPQQIDFQGIDNDIYAYATDDHTIVGNTIYTSLREYIGGDQLWQCKFIASNDNGETWDLISEHINVPEINSVEKGFEYLGNNRIVCVGSEGWRNHVLLTHSEDLGRTWAPWENILPTLGVWDRPRIWTLSHLKGRENWWQDPILIGVGNTTPGVGEKFPRANAIFISTNRGSTWKMLGGAPLDTFYNDGGYGDLVYDSKSHKFVYISYRDAEIVQYRFTLHGPNLCDPPLSADITGPAGVPDCVVDLYDFAEIAGQWLMCTKANDDCP